MISIIALEGLSYFKADAEWHYEIKFGIWVGLLIHDRLVSEALFQM